MEISSPGLGRALKKEKDFARSIGKEVDVKLYKAINKQKDFTGVLDSYDNEKVTLKFSDDSTTDFLRKDIAQIRLSIDF